MFSVGRVCVKLAGRDAGKRCVVVQIVDDRFVMIDGETRRRKCNKQHLEPLNESVDITENASHEQVAKALSITARNTTTKSKTNKPKKAKKTNASTETDAKSEKKAKKAKK